MHIYIYIFNKDTTPASSVSLIVKAGPRYETINNIGAAHYLKNFAFKVRIELN